MRIFEDVQDLFVGLAAHVVITGGRMKNRMAAVLSRGLFILASLGTNVALAQQYTFTHFAGTVGGVGYRDGVGTEARFDEPTGISVDAAGNIYVSDYGNHVIRRITPAGEVTSLAGFARQMAFADGSGFRERF